MSLVAWTGCSLSTVGFPKDTLVAMVPDTHYSKSLF